jgi:lipoyl(octanoyl) transferase
MNHPVLGLRMKPNSRWLLPVLWNQGDLRERLQVLISQETGAYKCSNYLDRRANEHDGTSVVPEDDVLDVVCREKMCEWSYRVCDHFHVEREIVAVAFSYLDRFVDRCLCDRTTFKLAAMTSLFMATKIFNTNKISLRSLVELSKGQYEDHNILEMEMAMLLTLSWQVNPPTLQCFVEHLCAVLPSLFDETRVIICVYKRAMFLAELAVYDFAFVTRGRATVAMAAILNAIEGLEERVMPESIEEQFVESIATSFGLAYKNEDLESVRRHLWYVYSKSAQCREDEVVPAGYHEGPEIPVRTTKQNENGMNPTQLSPVCVTSS